MKEFSRLPKKILENDFDKKKNKLERLLLYCIPCQEILLGQPRPLHGLSPCPHRHAS